MLERDRMNKPVLLAAVGDVNHVGTWSGIPYHLLSAARDAGVMQKGLTLNPSPRFRQLARYGWNLGRVLLGRGTGGYQFSDAFLQRMWAPQHAQLKGARVVNCFQLFPLSILRDSAIEKWFYIDQTLPHYLGGYGLGANISHSTMQEIYQREAYGYQQATGIITHSRWAAQSVITGYGVAAEKVHVVVPGANLQAAAYSEWARRTPPCADTSQPLRLVFVGKEPLRKGLDRLIRALQLARRAGAQCQLRVIGCAPELLPAELRDVDGVEWLGFIPKQQSAQRYLDAVASCDVGCLLSHAEAGGICLREFHALGLAVIAPDVGGSPDHALAGASHLVSPESRDEEIAALIICLSRDRAAVQQLRDASWHRRHEVLWPHAVDQLKVIWG